MVKSRIAGTESARPRLVVSLSHRVLSYSLALDLIGRSHPLRTHRPLSLPDVDGLGSSGQPVPSQRDTGLRGGGDTQVTKRHFTPAKYWNNFEILRFAVKSLEWFGGKTRILAEIDQNPVMRCLVSSLTD